MKWFGETWHAPVNHDVEHAATPVGTPCMGCGQPIGKTAQGLLLPQYNEPVERYKGESIDDYIVRAAESVRELPWHLECHIRAVLGPNMRGSFPRPR